MLKQLRWPNLHSDGVQRMLSAHQPSKAIRLIALPRARLVQLRRLLAACRRCAMASPGQSAWNWSLFSRDVIAMSTGIALSHGMFDGTLCLACATRLCGAADRRAGIRHLPTIFVRPVL